jgi:transcriptional regulator with XRE-family HTH domain
VLNRGQSVWDQFGSDEEFERELRELMPFAELAWTILELRARHGLTQQQLAERIGSTQSVIARLESGEHDARIGILNRIAQALDMRWRVTFEHPAAEAIGALEHTNVAPLLTLRLRDASVRTPAHGSGRRQLARRPLVTEQPALALAS